VFFFSSKKQRLRNLLADLEKLVCEKAVRDDLQTQEVPQSLCTCVRVTPEQDGSVMKLKATVHPCTKRCEGSVIGLDSGGAIVALKQEKRVVSKKNQGVLYIHKFECQFQCGFRGSFRKVVVHEGCCRLKDVASEMVPPAPRANSSQADVLLRDGSNDNPLNVPLWIYYVRRVQYLQQKDSSSDTPLELSLPSRPSHVKHLCSECKKPFIFGRMQACSAAKRDEADRLLCRLCGKRCRLFAKAMMQEHTESTESAETTIRSSARMNAGSRQPQQQIVDRYCKEEIPVRESGDWLDRLRKRIEASHEIK
jgi:hypothetical protein